MGNDELVVCEAVKRAVLTHRGDFGSAGKAFIEGVDGKGSDKQGGDNHGTFQFAKPKQDRSPVVSSYGRGHEVQVRGDRGVLVLRDGDTGRQATQWIQVRVREQETPDWSIDWRGFCAHGVQ